MLGSVQKLALELIDHGHERLLRAALPLLLEVRTAVASRSSQHHVAKRLGLALGHSR